MSIFGKDRSLIDWLRGMAGAVIQTHQRGSLSMVTKSSLPQCKVCFQVLHRMQFLVLEGYSIAGG